VRRFLFNLTFDSREFQDFVSLASLHPPDSLSVPIDVGEQLGSVDAEPAQKSCN